MSHVVDERVVKMEFDNRNFEKNTRQTMSTLDKLKNSLNFKGAARGFEELDRTSKKLNFSGMANGLETVRMKFSSLQVIGATALANITNDTINAGKRITDALTIAAPKDGFDEYELKMGSIQTIMSSTGESLETVNGYLNELNTYSDKTIYNFSDMTENIGKFTNAGVGLKDAVKAIQGISNEAALSGANANEASRAMYNFSQALSSGSVKLIDWKSIEIANMATKEFKEELMKTAEELGTLIKVGDEYKSTTVDNNGSTSDWFTSTKMFNDSLSSQWMTTEVLTKTLARYADEQTDLGKRAFHAAQDVKTFTQLMDTLKEALGSGWAQTWEIAIGNFDEAKAVFTKASNFFGDIIGEQADARNAMVKGAMQNIVDMSEWQKLKEAGGVTKEFRKDLIETAEKHGFAVKQMMKDGQSFEQTLSKGWLSSDLFQEALDKNQKKIKVSAKSMQEALDKVKRATSDQLVADPDNRKLKKQMEAYEKLEPLIKSVYKKSGKNVSELTDEEIKSLKITKKQVTALKDLERAAKNAGTPIGELNEKLSRKTGREMIIDTIFNLFNAFKKITKVAGKAWKEIFPPATAEQLRGTVETITSSIDNFTNSITNDKEKLENLRKTFEGMFAVLDIIKTVVGAGFAAAWNVGKGVLEAFDLDVLSLTANIGDAILSFRDWLKSDNALVKGLQKAGTTIGVVLRNAVRFVKWAKELPFVKKVIESIKEVFTKLGEACGDGFSGLDSVFNSLMDKLEKLDDLSFDNIVKTIKEFFSSFKNGSKDAGSMNIVAKLLTNAKNTIVGVYTELKDKTDKFGDGFVSVFEFIKDKLSKINMGHIITAIGGYSLIKGVNAFSKIANGLSSFLRGFSEIGIQVTNTIKQLGDVFKAVKLKLVAESVKVFSESLLILAGALFVISKIDKDRVWGSVGALAALMGIMIVFSKIGGGVSGTSGTAKAMAGMLAMALSMLVIVRTLRQMEKLDPKKALTNVMLMGMVAAEMSIVMLASRAGHRDKDTKNNVLVQMALALLGFAVACRMIGNMEPAKMAQALVTVGILSTICVAMIGISKLSGEHASKAGSMLVKMGASLMLVAVACRMIGNMDPGKLYVALSAITTISAIFVAMVGISKFSGEHADKAGSMLMKMSAGLVLIGVACRMIGNTDSSKIGKAVGAITAITAIFTLMVGISKFSGEHADKAGSLLLKMSAAFVVLSVAIAVLSNIDSSGIAKGVAAIAGVTTCFAMLIKSTGEMGNADNAVSMLKTMAVTLGILSVALAGLSFIPVEKLAGAVAALDLTILSMSVLYKASSKMGKATSGMLVMIGALAMVSGIVMILSKMRPKIALKSAEAIGLLLLSLSASMKIASNAKMGTKTLAALGIMSLALLEVGAILGVMSGLNIHASIEDALAISALLLAMAGVTAILSKIGAGSASAIGASASMDVVIAIIGAFIVGVGALFKECESLEGYMDKGLEILAKLAYGLGDIVGELFAGLADGFMKCLPGIGESIRQFWKNLQPFLKGVKRVDESTIAACGNVAKMILIFAGAELLDGIANFIGMGSKQSMEKFAEGIGKFGEAICDFASSIASKGISKESIAQVSLAAEAGKYLAEMCNSLPREGGWIDSIIGVGDMDKFTANMAKFGTAIVGFSKIVAGNIDSEAVESAANAGSLLAELENNLKNHGGKLQEVLGDSDLDTFGDQLKKFGKAIVKFSKTVSGNVDEAAVESAANAGKMLSELENGLKDHNGLLQDIIGDSDLDTFGNQLVSYGRYISIFGREVKDLKKSDVKKASTAGEMLSKLEDNLPDHNGVLQAWTGDDDLAQFGYRLVQFGVYLKAFSNTVKELDTDSVTAAKNASDMLVTLEKGLGDKNAWWENLFGSGKKTLSDFGDELVGLGGSIKEFSDAMTGVDKDLIVAVPNALETVVNAAKATEDGVNTNGLAEVLVTMANSSIKAFTDKFQNARDTVKTAIATFIGIFRGTVRDNNESFISTGRYVVDGFVSGINERIDSGDVYSAGTKIGKLLIKGAKKALDIHSPSKEMYKVGSFAIDGFLNAIADGSGTVKKVSSQLFKGFVKEATSIASTSSYAKKSINSFVKMYGDASKKTDKQRIAASKSLSAYIKKLYKESDAYKEDKKQLKEHTQALKDLYKKKAQLQKKLTAQEKKDAADQAKRQKAAEKALQKSITNDQKKSKNGNGKKSDSDDPKMLEYYKKYNKLVTDGKIEGEIKKGVGDVTDTVKNKAGEAKKVVTDIIGGTTNEIKKGADKQVKAVTDAANTEKKVVKETAKETESETTKNNREKLTAIKKEKGAVTDAQKSIRKELKQNEKDIKKANKQIQKDGETMKKHAKQVFKAVRDEIKNTVKEYANMFNVNLKSKDGLFESVEQGLKSTKTIMKEARESITETLKSYMELSSVSMETGLSLFEEFNANGEEKQRTEALTAATEDLTNAKKELAEANAEEAYVADKLAKAQAKSNAVNGRSQKFLDAVAEAQKELADAKAKTAEKAQAEADAQKAVNDARKDTRTEDTLKNMESQIDGVTKLKKNLESLAKRGIDEGLLKSLKDLGVSGSDQVATFVRMTDAELKRANELFKKSAKLSGEALIDGFKEKINDVKRWGANFKKLSKLGIADDVKQAMMAEFKEQGVESNGYISAILKMSPEELKDLESSYREYMKVPGDIAKEVAKYNKETILAENQEVDTSVSDTLKDMEANTKKYDTWVKNLKKLRKNSIVDKDLLAYLEDLGYEGADKVAIFVKMTDDELKRANELFEKSGSQASDALIEGFGSRIADAQTWQKNIEALSKLDLPTKVKEALFKEIKEKGIDSNEYIETILNMNDKQRDKFVQKYLKYMDVQDTIADKIMATGAAIETEISNNMSKVLETASKATKKVAKKSGGKIAAGLLAGVTEKIVEGKKQPKKECKTLSLEMNTATKTYISKPKAQELGKNFIAGLAAGIRNHAEVTRSVTALATTAIETFKKRMGIHSPSKEFEKLGMYSTEGYAIGLNRYSGVVADATESVGSVALRTMSDSISKIASIINSDMDAEPTIRPVLDMSDVKSGIADINGMFGDTSIGVRANGIASSISSQFGNRTDIQNATNNSYDYSQQNKIENVFNITGDNPKEIANEVSIILQKQLNRKGAAWA